MNASGWEVEKRGWLHKSSEEDTTRESGSTTEMRRPSVEGHACKYNINNGK